ncbi:hypothetical protein Hanom_Chr04g00353891 [Helianthus anomalus]
MIIHNESHMLGKVRKTFVIHTLTHLYNLLSKIQCGSMTNLQELFNQLPLKLLILSDSGIILASNG